MERRVRSDAVLARLPKEQREQLKGWLLEERLSLRDVQQKLQDEFHLKISHVAISRHDQRLRHQETLVDFNRSLDAAYEVPLDGPDLARLQQASVALLTHQAFTTLERGQCEPETLRHLGALLLRASEVKVRQERQQLAVYKAQDKVMTKAMLEAEKLRPVWEAANMDPEYRRMEGMLKFNPWMPPEVEARYRRLKAEHEARRCPHCEQLQPKGWEKVKENQAKIEEILLGTPEERARSQAEVQAQQAVIWEQIQREQAGIETGRKSDNETGLGNDEARMSNDQGNPKAKESNVQSPVSTPTQGVRGSHPPTDAQGEAQSVAGEASKVEGKVESPGVAAVPEKKQRPPAWPGFEWVGDFAMREVSKYGSRGA